MYSKYIDVAPRYNGVIEKRAGIDIPDAEPKIHIHTTNDTAKNVLTITLFCPTQQAVSIEQQVTEDLMNYYHGEKSKLRQELQVKYNSKK